MIMSRHQHRYPRPYLATILYGPLLPVGLQHHFPFRHQSYCMWILAGRPAFARPYEGVHKSTLLL